MSKMIKMIIGVILVLVIMFCSINVCQDFGKSLKLDLTNQKLYTLSGGTRAILGKLHQPITVKLFYAETAALKGPDQIRFFNNYYEYVKSLLEEYVSLANGMIHFQVIDPRPYSESEENALQYGLKKFSITEEENFFFGLVVQTQFGVEKVIPFFSPDRQNFLEYDISYLIDTAITRQKSKIGILSSLPVMGDDVSGYMAQMMRMQGQQPTPSWTFVTQLQKQYEVKEIPTEVDEIQDVDILLVIHPKDLPEKTLFAIDQFVLKGGRTIVCVDPHCFADPPDQKAAMLSGTPPPQNSDLNRLFRTWGVEMPANTFAGDRSLALNATLMPNQRPAKLIGFLNLTQQCFSPDTVITAELNQIRLLFPGVLKNVEDSEVTKGERKIERRILLSTTSKGNSWSVSSPYELLVPDPQQLMKKFIDGNEPVIMGSLITGKFKSSFPDGIEVEIVEDNEESSDKSEEENKEKRKTEKITGLTEAKEECVVVIFTDVDFISDLVAYQDTFLGKIIVGDNSALLLNTIDDLRGSSDLISIRSRGSYQRPFVVVDEIEKQAERETSEEEDKINAEIAGFQNELSSIISSAKEGEEEIIGSTILQKKKTIELKIHKAQRELRHVKMKRRERIENLGNLLRNFNMLMTPAIILIIAIVLGVRRSVRKRHYISHASDS
ncbi:MAG: GldG family protein [Candidatus Scalindua sp.]|nr:GldG family protein [Candidatus Scalindua sp.]